eukprot:evm.model.scf_612.7 EVM.evm.TU.scf_612.7   scf_612:61063-64453(+)
MAGRKQSPFVGKTVPLVDADGGPILYKRYRDVSEITTASCQGKTAGVTSEEVGKGAQNEERKSHPTGQKRKKRGENNSPGDAVHDESKRTQICRLAGESVSHETVGKLFVKEMPQCGKSFLGTGEPDKSGVEGHQPLAGQAVKKAKKKRRDNNKVLNPVLVASGDSEDNHLAVNNVKDRKSKKRKRDSSGCNSLQNGVVVEPAPGVVSDDLLDNKPLAMTHGEDDALLIEQSSKKIEKRAKSKLPKKRKEAEEERWHSDPEAATPTKHQHHHQKKKKKKSKDPGKQNVELSSCCDDKGSGPHNDSECSSKDTLQGSLQGVADGCGGSGSASAGANGLGSQATQPPKGGNAEEAARMRNILGFTHAKNQPTADSVFQFQFDSTRPPVRETADDHGEGKSAKGVDDTNESCNKASGDFPFSIYAGGMPYFWSEEDIRQFWSECGHVISVRCLTFGDSGKFRGIACVSFDTQEGLQAALACDGDPCQCEGDQGRGVHSFKVAVKKWTGALPTPHSQRPSNTAGRHGGASVGKTPGYNVAFVCNIPYSVIEEQLLELFSEHDVDKVRLHTNQYTGVSCGFAHVHFKSGAGLDSAMALHGTELNGRSLVVGYAKPPPGFSQSTAAREASGQSEGPRSNGIGSAGGERSCGKKIPGYYVAFVSNIPYETNNMDLRRHFKGCPIEKIILLTNKQTGEFVGSAFVQFADEASLDRAVGMDGRKMKEPAVRQLRVRYAQKRLKELMPSEDQKVAGGGQGRTGRLSDGGGNGDEGQGMGRTDGRKREKGDKASSKAGKVKQWTEEDDPLLALL